MKSHQLLHCFDEVRTFLMATVSLVSTMCAEYLAGYATYWCVSRRVAGWVAGGCWDYYENSSEMNHSLIPYVFSHQ